MSILKHEKHRLRHKLFENEKVSCSKGLGKYWGQCQRCELNYSNLLKSPQEYLKNADFIKAKEDQYCALFPDGIPKSIYFGHQERPFSEADLKAAVSPSEEE